MMSVESPIDFETEAFSMLQTQTSHLTAGGARPRRRHLPGAALLFLLLAMHGMDAHASRGNPFGFAESASSSVNYTATPYLAMLKCSEMSKTTASGVVLTAQLVAASTGTP
ncbi:hypothetical protein LP416_19880 [Polaromonas sp. P2-4]|nr:hypothetical protein LP416_19880 [Polaromonas sp. P2-4]